MVYYIENEFFKVGVKDHGAELTSVRSKETDFEYLWQGDESIWYGQSPILFPIVGRLYDDKYFINGKEYTMPKHGLARKLDFKLLDKDSDQMSFILSESKETLEKYPYAFDLIVTYTLDGRKLRVNHSVVNKNDCDMYFSLGAHPGFNCALGDYLEFDENETLFTEKINLDKSLRIPGKFPVLNNEKRIVITKDIFNEDALILKDIKSENVTLASPLHNRTVKFNLGNAPYLGIWAKPGAPYVCIEPWCGVNDADERTPDFSMKTAINKLAADEIFDFAWEAEFSE